MSVYKTLFRPSCKLNFLISRQASPPNSVYRGFTVYKNILPPHPICLWSQVFQTFRLALMNLVFCNLVFYQEFCLYTYNDIVSNSLVCICDLRQHFSLSDPKIVVAIKVMEFNRLWQQQWYSQTGSEFLKPQSLDVLVVKNAQVEEVFTLLSLV